MGHFKKTLTEANKMQVVKWVLSNMNNNYCYLKKSS